MIFGCQEVKKNISGLKQYFDDRQTYGRNAIVRKFKVHYCKFDIPKALLIIDIKTFNVENVKLSVKAMNGNTLMIRQFTMFIKFLSFSALNVIKKLSFCISKHILKIKDL